MVLRTGSIALLNGYDTNVWPTVMYDVSCSGDETSLWNCSYSVLENGVDCDHDASVTCKGNHTEARTFFVDSTDIIIIDS